MSVFDANSRYVKFSAMAQATDRKGLLVSCVLPARIPLVANLGRHRLQQGQRLDHLADRYLGDATGFWRIAHHDDAMTVDQIAEASFIAIPVRGA